VTPRSSLRTATLRKLPLQQQEYVYQTKEAAFEAAVAATSLGAATTRELARGNMAARRWKLARS
jgi:hypothetical protein